MTIHPDEERFRHGWWIEKRKLILARLNESMTSGRIVESFANCGANCVVEWSPTAQKFRLSASYCHSRHCQACMATRGNIIAANLKQRLAEQKKAIGTRANGQFKFICLTLKSSPAPLRDQIKHLYASFRKLRNMKLWKARIPGGAAFLEVTWNEKSRMWHPHLHLIAQGNFIDKRDLSAMWKQATGDSTIVDISEIKTEKDVAHYATKYVSKGCDLDIWQDPEAAAEWMCSLRGVRMCLTFGTWRGFKLTKAAQKYDDWTPRGHYLEILSRARDGCDGSIAILQRITKSETPEEVRSHYKMDAG